ncbi:Ionotropic receptor 75j [Blattella germanica]|nr:Ionotropic receptor 75j [Blattella germanica]
MLKTRFILFSMLISWLVPNNESIELNTEDKFIISLLTFHSKHSLPAQNSMFLCHNTDSTYQLFRELSKNYIELSILTKTQSILNQLRETKIESRCIFILDMSCPNSSAILQQAQVLALFNKKNKWILLNNYYPNVYDSENITDTSMTSVFKNSNSKSAKMRVTANQQLINELTRINLLIDSDVSVATRISRNRFILEEVYKRREESNLVTNEIGYWVEEFRLVIYNAKSLSSRRMDFQKSLIKVVMVVINKDTMKHLTDAVDRHIDSLSKANYALFHHIKEIMNASIEILTVDSWGYEINGTWTGECGYLQRRETDIAITPMFITKQRLTIVEFMSAPTPTRVEFIFRQPPLSFVQNIYTLPFSGLVWLCSFLLFSLMGILFYCALKWEFCTKENESSADNMPITWSDIVMSTVGAICEQGTLMEGQRIPSRIILTFLFVTVIFLNTSYSAYIVALMQSTTNSIRTLNDLLNSGLTLAAEDIVYNRYFFSVAKDPVRRAIYTKKINPPGGPQRFYPIAEGIERVRKGFFAFNLELGIAYKVISDTFNEEEKCNLQTMNFLIEVRDPYLAISKNSPYREIFLIAYRMVHERGLQQRQNLRFYNKKPKCNSPGTAFMSTGIVDFYPVLVTLGIGLVSSVCIFILEIILHRKLCTRKHL